MSMNAQVRLQLFWYVFSALLFVWLLIHPGRPDNLMFTISGTVLFTVIITRSVDGFVRTLRGRKFGSELTPPGERLFSRTVVESAADHSLSRKRPVSQTVDSGTKERIRLGKSLRLALRENRHPEFLP
jgi:hypothetical protein